MADSRFHFGRQYDFYEVLADGIVHGVGVALALVGVTALIFHTAISAERAELLAAAIYGGGLILALAASFTYNMLPHSPLKWYLRRLDHSAIFILIAATYTPFLHKASSDPTVLALLVSIWTMAALGVALKCLLPGRYDRLAILLYILMGWSGLIAFGPISDHLPPVSMLLIVVGGVVYTAGVIFHVWQRLRFQNAIWHGFVVTAAAIHYVAVLVAV
ncbi:PAQR family membrane homeostasis protein TrhA [Paracoccus benzoatiresistens]|uniref:Hemolysin III family protein n=1 Tax=Paracoccus benzoatiresistens TaxID=2997341 RepID=A0ABT4J4I1_9RHOB|nr:hemolysin III family protein [Paracoccus sp. EF6]MCZ0961809.1 hemolysin III family protein [Paracoccus sp. EF6]